MHTFSLLSLTLLLWYAATPALAVRRSSNRPTRRGLQDPIEPPGLGRYTSQGCFASLGNPELAHPHDVKWNSPSECLNGCRNTGRHVVGAMHGDACYCMDVYPPWSLRVPDAACDKPCPGYPWSACGGFRVYSVFNLGIDINVEYQADPADLIPSSSAWKEAVERLGDMWEAATAAGEKLGSSTLSGIRGATSTTPRSPFKEPARDVDDSIEL